MAVIRLEIPGRPISWRAPSPGKHRWYSQKEMRVYQDKVRLLARAAHRGPPLTKARLSITFEIHGTRRWDLTNVEKNIEDALQGIIYKNDNQIDEKKSKRVWTKDPAEMKAVVTVMLAKGEVE